MADSKITALTSISTSTDPANDPLVIVDVSDTSMAASGTTKKVTLNNLLACSPTATLASATITGDLTVATNRLSVSSTGVQIGTTTNKTTAFTGNGTGLTIGAALSPTIALWDTTNASYVGSISQIDADMYLTNTAVGQMVFSTDNTSRYTISSTGVATWSNVGGVAGTGLTLNATSNLVLRGGTAGANGVGLTFPATQAASSDANCLDDYEEGTWTGTLTGATTDPTIPVTATGRYTKVGRLVTVQINFSNVTTTGASGQIKVTGLPFTNNGTSSTCAPVLLYSMGTFTGSPVANVGINESFLGLFSNITNAAFGDVTHNAGVTRFLTTSITYTV